MHVIAALRETLPHADFVNFANEQDTRLPGDFRALRESPLYCRPTGYHTISEVVTPDSSIFLALDLGRKLTRAFSAQHRYRGRQILQVAQVEIRHYAHELERLANEVFTLPPAADLEFRSMAERYTYEAIRLTTRLYAHALANRIPFSEAAAQLSAMDAATNPTEMLSMRVQIRNALMRTVTTDCWSRMAGVLFWIALITGAAANLAAAPTHNTNRQEPTVDDEEEEARKWLAAVLIRCSIVMGFEHGPSIMQMMKTMIGIQQALGSSSTYSFATEEEARRFTGLPRRYGPPVPPPTQAVQKGFAEFAQDFLDS